jgi:hypothetical protein
MTRDQAQREAARRNDELEPGTTQRWFAREDKAADGTWSLVRVAGLPAAGVSPLKTAVEAKPAPSPQDDPRTAYDRNVGGPWIG